MQTWSHIYDAIRCEPSDVSGYLIRTSGCLIWHYLTTLVLGPTFFLVYINDLPDVVHSMVNLFADDANVSAVVNSECGTKRPE